MDLPGRVGLPASFLLFFILPKLPEIGRISLKFLSTKNNNNKWPILQNILPIKKNGQNIKLYGRVRKTVFFVCGLTNQDVVLAFFKNKTKQKW